MHRLSGIYGSALWAMEREFGRVNRDVSEQIRSLREQFKRQSGVVSQMLPGVLGPVWLWTARREGRRLARGKTYEPPTMLERRNWTQG
jgi:hypothetical protein